MSALPRFGMTFCAAHENASRSLTFLLDGLIHAWDHCEGDYQSEWMQSTIALSICVSMNRKQRAVTIAAAMASSRALSMAIENIRQSA